MHALSLPKPVLKIYGIEYIKSGFLLAT